MKRMTIKSAIKQLIRLKSYFQYQLFADDINAMNVAIDTLKQADRRPVGEWIAYQEDRWIYAKCSECGTIQDVRSNYCPECGTKMNMERQNDNNGKKADTETTGEESGVD